MLRTTSKPASEQKNKKKVDDTETKRKRETTSFALVQKRQLAFKNKFAILRGVGV